MTATQRSTPTVNVRAAFRCQEEPVSLPGGQGEAFRCGDIILKPCSDIDEARWVAQLHLDVQQVGFRLPQPVSATGGAWVVDGWQAWGWVDGSHRKDRWRDVICTCRAFHRAVEHIARPAFLDRRGDVFARADRIAWAEEREERADFHPRVAPVIEQLRSLVEPVDLPNQLIHGDMTENVLFAADLPPAVIDISPFWRPAAYAQAIVVVDALDWCDADASILDLVEDITEIYQLMVRAEMFRIAVLDGFHKEGIDTLGALSGHLQTVDMLTHRLGQVTKGTGTK